jgi:hypothetical protein
MVASATDGRGDLTMVKMTKGAESKPSAGYAGESCSVSSRRDHDGTVQHRRVVAHELVANLNVVVEVREVTA